MRTPARLFPAAHLTVIMLGMAACGKAPDTPARATTDIPAATTSTTAPAATGMTQATGKHHSKLAGAAIGAAAGHMLGGHAVAGAAAGALIQHERNKHRR